MAILGAVGLLLLDLSLRRSSRRSFVFTEGLWNSDTSISDEEDELDLYWFRFLLLDDLF